jgi:acylphosphatase
MPPEPHADRRPRAVRALVEGRVQGVFFRASTRAEAERRGVAGWAANRPDGSVEVLLEGAPDAVGELIDFLHEGPPHAHVSDVRVDEVAPRGLDRFAVR